MRTLMTQVAKSGAAKLLRAARRLVWSLLRLAYRVRGRPADADRLRVRILLQHAYGMGGTIRTTLNLAGHLAQRYDVEIVSIARTRDKPFFPFPPGVRVTVVEDRRAAATARWSQRMLARLPSLLTPPRDSTYAGVSLRTDLRLAKILCAGGADVLIGTRPALNLLIAEVAPRSVITIGQDHMNLGAYRPWLHKAIDRSYRRLGALTTLTESSLLGYAQLLAGTQVRIACIPNAVPALGGGLAGRTAKTIVAAGRLARNKGFDLLLEAYEEVARAHPDWRLDIFGSGRERDALAKIIADRGLAGTVALRGRSADLGAELAGASIFVLASRSEGMPMVIIEAMSKALPVVAFDCPTGPAELIDHGRSGLLVSDGDTAALGAALCRLIESPPLRHRLGEQALIRARDYDLAAVGARWEALIDDLVSARTPAPPSAA